MKVTRFSRLTGVSVATVRRWVEVYQDFLTPGANPPKGEVRRLSAHDQRVLYHAAQLRESGLGQDAVLERLRGLQSEQWQGLAELPPEWQDGTDSIPVSVASARTSEIVQASVLQNELQHIRRELEEAQNRVGELQDQLEAVESQLTTSEEEKSTLRLELEQARGQVATLEAKLAGYSLGGERPLSVALIIGVSLLAGALLVLVSFVVARLIL